MVSLDKMASKMASLISSSTELVILFAAGSIAVNFAISWLGILFSPLDTFYLTKLLFWLGIVVIICFIIFVIVFSFSTLIRKLIEKKSYLSRCKCLSLFGYGGITLFAIVPRIPVFFLGRYKYHDITWPIGFFSLVTCFFIYWLILRSNSKHLQINYRMDGTASWLWKHLLAHIIVLIVTIRIAFAFFESKNDREAIFGFQVASSIFCGPSIFDFCQVLRGGVILKKDNNESTNEDNQNPGLMTENIENPIETRDPEPGNNFKLECKICTMGYSETRIPRMLKECGHTICEGCADELLKKNNQRHLCCPFCQEMTSVKGPANLLPKNYALLEAVEKMK